MSNIKKSSTVIKTVLFLCPLENLGTIHEKLHTGFRPSLKQSTDRQINNQQIWFSGTLIVSTDNWAPPPKNVDRLISEYVDRLRYIR